MFRTTKERDDTKMKPGGRIPKFGCRQIARARTEELRGADGWGPRKIQLQGQRSSYNSNPEQWESAGCNAADEAR